MAKLDKIKLDKAITQKYQIADNTFFAVPKSNPRDKVELEVGDSKTANEFLPQQKIKRWDNEVNCSLRLVHDEKSPEVITEDGKIKWKGSKVEAHFYDIKNDEHPKGASEFEILLLKDPRTKKTGNYQVKFTVVDKGVEYFKQPMERKQHPNGHWSCDENVLGSYAVYAKENKINWTGGKEYKCGKVGHIYRPRIEDSAGKWVWGDLNIANGFLTVDIPQEFLDKAVYPVKHAAGLTFGYTTAGSYGSFSGTANAAYGSMVSSAVSSNATVDSISAYTYSVLGYSMKGFVTASNLAILTNGVGGVVTVPYPSVWATSVYSTKPSVVSGSNYYPFVIFSGNSCGIYYDNGSGNNSLASGSNNYTTPTNPNPGGGYDGVKYSIYATYTAAPITKELAETVTHTDECRKQNSRYFLETVSHLSSLINQASRTFLETVNHTSSLIKLLGRILSETANHTSSVIKQNGRTLSDTVTHTDVFSSIKSKFSTLTDTVTYTSSLIKQNGRTILETVTHTDTFSKVKTFVRTMTETVNHTASVIKGVGRTIFDIVNHASSFIKQNSRTLLEATTHTSTFSSIVSRVRTLTETVNHADSLIKMCGRTISETANHTANAIKQFSKTVLETVNHISSLVKTPQRSFLETTLSFTDNFSALKVLTYVYAETISFLSSISRQSSKIFSDTSVFLANLTNQTNKIFGETISFSSNLIRQIGRFFGETTSLIADFFGHIETKNKVLEEVATFYDNFSRNIYRILEEIANHTSTFLYKKFYFFLFEETINFYSYIFKLPGRILGETLSISAGLYKNTSVFFQETITFTGSVLKILSRTIGEIISFSGYLLRVVGKTFSETSSFSANTYKRTEALFGEAVTFTGSVFRRFSREITETISFFDNFARQAVKFFSETVSHSSSFTSGRIYIFSAAANFSSSLSSLFSKTLTLQEVVSFVDSVRLYLNGIRAGLWAMIGKATDNVWDKSPKATDNVWDKSPKE
jgi:hypothetical protein